MGRAYLVLLVVALAVMLQTRKKKILQGLVREPLVPAVLPACQYLMGFLIWSIKSNHPRIPVAISLVEAEAERSFISGQMS